MAHGLKDREGQIPTSYPSSPFTVTQFEFALRAITLNNDDDSRPACHALGLGVLQPTTNIFGTLRASAAGQCTLFRALHAWSAKGRASFAAFTARCELQLLMWASHHTAVL